MVSYVVDRLIFKPHSATGLVSRLEALGLVTRRTVENDRRRALLELADRAYAILADLSARATMRYNGCDLLAAIFDQLNGHAASAA